MDAKQILEQLSDDIKPLKVGGVVINDQEPNPTKGLDLDDLIKEAKKLSKQNVISYPKDVSFC